MAPNYLSPGVYVLEKDISEYSPTLNSSIVGIVGFASKGPTNEATLITSAESLVKTFGAPSETVYGQALEAALEILEATNKVYFIRVSDSDTELNASALVPIGACPAVQIAPSGFGFTENLVLKVQGTDHTGANLFSEPKTFNIPSGTVTGSYSGNGAQYAALKSVIGGELTSNKVFIGYRPSNGNLDETSVVNHIFIGNCFAGSGCTLSVSSYAGDGTTAISGVYPVDQTDSGVTNSFATQGQTTATSYGATIVAPTSGSGFGYRVQSLYPGEGYNLSTDSNGDTIGVSIEIDQAGDSNSIFTVNSEGASVENFKVGLLIAPEPFAEDIINVGTTSPVSEYIQATFVSSLGSGEISDYDFSGIHPNHWGFKMSAASMFQSSVSGIANGESSVKEIDPMFIKLADSTTPMYGGTNGEGPTDSASDALLIGSPTTEPKTGLYLLDNPTIDISIGLVPGVYTQTVQNALITLAESTQNFLALVAPPEGVGGVQDAIDWTNGQTDSRTAAINSSYAAVYWPHVKTFSVFDGVDRYLDPSIYGARQMVYTDSVSDPWFAPAGFVRGRLTKPTETEVQLSQGDRDALYSGGNVVNPIVNFPGQGITIFGQRTTQRTPSALDRINVRRMMIVIKKLILASTQQFVFEPNDEITWNRIESVMQPLLNDIKRRRGITEFRVVCDSTTNTPVRIDRNELWCKVLIRPTKTAEIIVFELNLTNQSAKLG